MEIKELSIPERLLLLALVVHLWGVGGGTEMFIGLLTLGLSSSYISWKTQLIKDQLCS